MTLLAEFHFLQPQWLWLLGPVWLLILVHARRGLGKTMWERSCDARLLAAMTAGQGSRRLAGWTAGLLGGVLSIGIVATAGPSWSRVEQPLMEATSARVILLDLSRAMLVEDVRPSRFLHAQAAAAEIAADDFAGETGLVVFAGAAFVLSPLSRDSESLLAFIEAVDPSTMPEDGGNLGAAIDTGVELLAASLSGQGQLLLVTAGDSTDSTAVQAARQAATEGQRISVLAVGSPAGGPLRDDDGNLLRDAAGRVRISQGNLGLLQRIANAGNGSFAIAGRAIHPGDLLNSRIQADELVESSHEATRRDREAANDGAWLVWLMLFPALLLFRRNQLWILMLVFLLPLPQEIRAAGSDPFWQHRESVAYDAYRRGDHDRVWQLSSDSMLLGASYYRSAQFEQALTHFEEADGADAAYNYANALVHLERYTEALSAYERALQLDPGLSRARYNKRLLEHFLEQQTTATTPSEDGSDDAENNTDSPGEDGVEARIGDASERQTNPAEDPEIGSGSGASLQGGQVDPTERFGGEDPEAERFVLRAQDIGDAMPPESVERWISSLPETSSELYRRKFLRDYRRQQQQER